MGKLEAFPGAGNVIAGKVTASLDVRHADDTVRHAAVLAMTKEAESAATRHRTQVTANTQLDQPAVPLDPALTTILQNAAAQAGFPSRRMTSGAGHDAMILAPVIPSAMLFLRSPGGLSHHPDEFVLPHDVEAALVTVMEFLTQLGDDRGKLEDGHA
jgi:allantoate deiminase